MGTRLGEVLQALSFTKSVPDGLKLSECERGVGGKNLPICYIPKVDPVQEKKKTTYFKLTLPLMKSEMSMAQWASRTPEQFFLHVRATIHACKQMELDGNFSKAKRQSQMQSMTWKSLRRLMHKFPPPRKRRRRETQEKPHRQNPNP